MLNCVAWILSKPIRQRITLRLGLHAILWRYPIPRLKQTDDGLTKSRRYRQQQQRRGMKQLRIWVPDPNRPEFAAEARRQGLALRGRAEEAEALGFIGVGFGWPET